MKGSIELIVVKWVQVMLDDKATPDGTMSVMFSASDLVIPGDVRAIILADIFLVSFIVSEEIVHQQRQQPRDSKRNSKMSKVQTEIVRSKYKQVHGQQNKLST